MEDRNNSPEPLIVDDESDQEGTAREADVDPGPYYRPGYYSPSTGSCDFASRMQSVMAQIQATNERRSCTPPHTISAPSFPSALGFVNRNERSEHAFVEPLRPAHSSSRASATTCRSPLRLGFSETSEDDEKGVKRPGQPVPIYRATHKVPHVVTRPSQLRPQQKQDYTDFMSIPFPEHLRGYGTSETEGQPPRRDPDLLTRSTRDCTIVSSINRSDRAILPKVKRPRHVTSEQEDKKEERPNFLSVDPQNMLASSGVCADVSRPLTTQERTSEPAVSPPPSPPAAHTYGGGRGRVPSRRPTQHDYLRQPSRSRQQLPDVIDEREHRQEQTRQQDTSSRQGNEAGFLAGEPNTILTSVSSPRQYDSKAMLTQGQTTEQQQQSQLPHQAQEQQQRPSFLVGEPNTTRHTISRIRQLDSNIRSTQSQTNERLQQYQQQRPLFGQGTEEAAAAVFPSLDPQYSTLLSRTPVLTGQLTSRGPASPHPQQHPAFLHSTVYLHRFGGGDITPFVRWTTLPSVPTGVSSQPASSVANQHAAFTQIDQLTSRHGAAAVGGATAMLPPQRPARRTGSEQLNDEANRECRRRNNKKSRANKTKREMSESYALRLRYQKEAILARREELHMLLARDPNDETTLSLLYNEESQLLEVELMETMRQHGLPPPPQQQQQQRRQPPATVTRPFEAFPPDEDEKPDALG